MDLKILEIASNTENHKVVKNYTHQSKNKNPLCGDEMEISLIVKDDMVQEIGYQCKSCIYCQASVSMLSRWVIQLPIKKISDFVSKSEFFFDENFDQIKKNNMKDWKDFKKIFNSENISRKECLLLPFKTISKALNLKLK
jgi:nitrogen fixation protein NifU and related proteins